MRGYLNTHEKVNVLVAVHAFRAALKMRLQCRLTKKATYQTAGT